MNTPNIPESEIAAWVGLDWADQQQVICLQAADWAAVETSVVKQRPEAIQAWVAQLQARFPQGKVAIALEQSRGMVLYALMAYECLVLYPIPPKTLAKYREAFHSSGAKGDLSDAALLLDLVRRHRERFQAWVPDDPSSRQLRLLVEERRKLVAQKTRLTNELTSRLKSYFPQALDWVGELDTRLACDFLQRWPRLDSLQKARPAQLEQFYRRHHCYRSALIQQRLEQIRQAQPLTRDPAVIAATSLMVQALVRLLGPLLESILQFDQQIEALFAQHPDQALWASFPGAGPVLAPRLQAAFGSDRARFQQALELQQLSGIAPITQQSGKSRHVERRWARPKFLHQTFYEYAAQSRLACGWARAYYEQQRARGSKHPAAVRALAYKWIRLLFRCWQNRVPYNEETYLKALARHNPALRLAAEAAQSQMAKKKEKKAA